MSSVTFVIIDSRRLGAIDVPPSALRRAVGAKLESVAFATALQTSRTPNGARSNSGTRPCPHLALGSVGADGTLRSEIPPMPLDNLESANAFATALRNCINADVLADIQPPGATSGARLEGCYGDLVAAAARAATKLADSTSPNRLSSDSRLSTHSEAAAALPANHSSTTNPSSVSGCSLASLHLVLVTPNAQALRGSVGAPLLQQMVSLPLSLGAPCSLDTVVSSPHASDTQSTQLSPNVRLFRVPQGAPMHIEMAVEHAVLNGLGGASSVPVTLSLSANTSLRGEATELQVSPPSVVPGSLLSDHSTVVDGAVFPAPALGSTNTSISLVARRRIHVSEVNDLWLGSLAAVLQPPCPAFGSSSGIALGPQPGSPAAANDVSWGALHASLLTDDAALVVEATSGSRFLARSAPGQLTLPRTMLLLVPAAPPQLGDAPSVLENGPRDGGIGNDTMLEAARAQPQDPLFMIRHIIPIELRRHARVASADGKSAGRPLSSEERVEARAAVASALKSLPYADGAQQLRYTGGLAQALGSLQRPTHHIALRPVGENSAANSFVAPGHGGIGLGPSITDASQPRTAARKTKALHSMRHHQ